MDALRALRAGFAALTLKALRSGFAPSSLRRLLATAVSRRRLPVMMTDNVMASLAIENVQASHSRARRYQHRIAWHVMLPKGAVPR